MGVFKVYDGSDWQEIAGGGGGGSGSSFTTDLGISMSADQTGIVTGTITKVSFDTADWDGDSDFDAVNDYFVAPADGRYHMDATVRWWNNSTGLRQIMFRVNNGSVYYGTQKADATTSEAMPQTTSTTLNLSTSDYVEVVCYQTSGGPGTIDTTASSPCTWTIHRVQ